jgi:malate dehydrogenase (oxaloacetate-decarboxylating)
LLWISGARNVLAFHREGVAEIDGINNNGFTGDLKEAIKGADVFIGVSAANVLSEDDVKSMAINSIVFALANPDPEIDPTIARKYAAVVATGRSDHPNQINNVLAFPGIFRGLLDANASKITDALLVAAADAIASCVAPSQLNANFIIPSVFDPEVAKKVAAAVKGAAK